MINLDPQRRRTSVLHSPRIPPSQNTIIPFDFSVSPAPLLKKRRRENEREGRKKVIVSNCFLSIRLVHPKSYWLCLSSRAGPRVPPLMADLWDFSQNPPL